MTPSGGTAVATIEVASGVVRGFRYETRGGLDDIRFQIKDLWQGAEAGVTAVLKFPNLGILHWAVVGDIRNQTTWVDGDSIVTVFARNDGAELEDDEKEAAGIGKFALRFTLIPVAVDKVALSAGIVPFSKAVLQEKMTAAGSNLSSSHCPTIAVKLLNSYGKS